MNISNLSFANSYGAPCNVNVTQYTCKIGWDLIIFGFIGLYILSAVFHEFGHWCVLQLKSQSASIMFYKSPARKKFVFCTGDPRHYEGLSKDYKIAVYMAGIILGLLPIIIAGAFHDIFYLMIAPYIVNCYSDFEKVFRLMKNDKSK